MDDPPARFLDLGSGGGVPGLVLACAWPGVEVVLLEAQARRGEFLSRAVADLGLAGRVEVARAEVAGRSAGLREAFPLVTSRGFGPPAVTAECARPFLDAGGLLLVAEPPDAPDARWPAAGLAELGFVDEDVVEGGGAHVRRLRARDPLPDRYPRRDGVPSRRPLW